MPADVHPRPPALRWEPRGFLGEERKRFASALAHVHGSQSLHVASVSNGQPMALDHLHMDDGQVICECPMYSPRT